MVATADREATEVDMGISLTMEDKKDDTQTVNSLAKAMANLLVLNMEVAMADTTKIYQERPITQPNMLGIRVIQTCSARF